MQITITDDPYEIHILPFSEAPWAPVAPGGALRWAWRIIDAAGQVKMVGSSNDSETKLRDFTSAAVKRLKLLNNGKPTRRNILLPRKWQQSHDIQASAR